MSGVLADPVVDWRDGDRILRDAGWICEADDVVRLDGALWRVVALLPDRFVQLRRREPQPPAA